ncbi:unnamed protein product [Amoebophrya sp. A120]|nr:unnamed protein product [Amoebophrya sp. A120]|eukprot:GSA120T00022279001.1
MDEQENKITSTTTPSPTSMHVSPPAPPAPVPAVKNNLNDFTRGDKVWMHAAKLLQECDCLVITAGAGMGKDSGLPTFAEYGDRPVSGAGLSYVELCSPNAAQNHYEAFDQWWRESGELYAKTESHDGYRILESWLMGGATSTTSSSTASSSSSSCTRSSSTKTRIREHYVYTSNIDGHFKRFPNLGKNVLELHGSLTLPWIPWWRFEREDPSDEMDVVAVVESSATPPSSFVPSLDGTRKVPMSNCGPPFDYDPAKLLNSFPMSDRSRTPWQPPSYDCETPRGYIPKEYRRPAVLLFYDNCLELETFLQRKIENEWRQWVDEVLMKQNTKNKVKSLVVLELGCGVRVPSCRSEGERLVWEVNELAAAKTKRKSDSEVEVERKIEEKETPRPTPTRTANLIRINPAEPTFGFLRKIDNPLFWHFDEDDLCYRTIAGQEEKEMIDVGSLEQEDQRLQGINNVISGNYVLLNECGAKDALQHLDSLLKNRMNHAQEV